MGKLKRNSKRTLWLILLSCISAGALDPNRHLSQYGHTAWRIQDGFFSGGPHAITQTTDGYLWIGTEAGLLHFDGVRFVPWEAPPGKRLPSSRIYSLLGAKDGSLWIGTQLGLARWKDGVLSNFDQPRGFVESILQGANGTIWMTRSQVRDDKGPLCEVADNALRCHGTAEGISFPYAQPLAQDGQGNFWIGSSLGVCRWRPGSTATYLSAALRNAKGLAGASAIVPAPDGAIWVGMERSGKGLGLQQLVQGEWKGYAVSGMNGPKLEISSLMMDRDNVLWIGTTNQGIFRVRAGSADHFGSADGLSSDSVARFYQDREGNVWVVTARGIDRFRDTRVITFSIREGLTAESVDTVFAAHDGTLWIGNVQALNSMRNGKLSAIQEHHGLPGRLVTSMLEDHAGRMWIGIDGGLTVYEHDRFTPVNKPDGSPLGVVTGIVEDTDHNVWVKVTQPALFRIQDMQVREEVPASRIPRPRSMASDPTGGLWFGLYDGNLARYRQARVESFPTPVQGTSVPIIRNLLVDPDGSAWAASDQGLLRWKDGSVRVLNSSNGLPCNSIFTLIRDAQGSLWLDAQCGFLAIDPHQLEKWWNQPDAQVSSKVLDVYDGAQPAATNFSPEATRATDGTLWFANESVLQMIDPRHLAGNPLPPPVRIENVVADRKSYLPRDNLRLPARTRDIEIDYTALSLVVPEKVRFRYKLEGHDSDWQDPQARRQAFYSDLPPGDYRFRLIASNNDGVWNETGATLSFSVMPAFFQTTWFRWSCYFGGAALLWLVYFLRVRHLARNLQARLEERLEERERIARDLHDTLLQGIFSAAMQLEVAESQMADGSPAKPLVQHVLELMRRVGMEGRNTIRTLRSSHDESDGLEESFSKIQQEFALQKRVSFRVIAEGSPRRLRPLIRDEVYRIGREAVINAFRHSQANKIELELDYAPQNLRMLVRDDGCGIDAHLLRAGRDGHWGLSGMRERAEKIGAKLEVLSRIGAGTEVELSVPAKMAFESPSSGLPAWLTRLFPGSTERDGSPSTPKEGKR